jgi:uncharacterized repeat protein (TIGR04076 family)
MGIVDRLRGVVVPKVRITVVKRVVHMDLLDEHLRRDDFPQGYGPCEIMREGQTFVIDGVLPKMPDDFPCGDAWCDIQRNLASVMYGGNLPWVKQRGTAFASCCDGMRPVSFKIERIDG